MINCTSLFFCNIMQEICFLILINSLLSPSAGHIIAEWVYNSIHWWFIMQLERQWALALRSLILSCNCIYLFNSSFLYPWPILMQYLLYIMQHIFLVQFLRTFISFWYMNMSINEWILYACFIASLGLQKLKHVNFDIHHDTHVVVSMLLILACDNNFTSLCKWITVLGLKTKSKSRPPCLCSLQGKVWNEKSWL